MVKKKSKKRKINRPKEVELLEILIIIELAKAGVSQKKILKIVKGDIYRVNRIAKLFLKKEKLKPKKKVKKEDKKIDEVISLLKKILKKK